MSIWNIVEYKPRAPQAQGNLQSAYTVESDRVKPDLAAGFRVQHSDQNQFPNNSFLFLENAARLPQIDPYAWGDTYENILQVKEDYNRGFIPTLDCLSVRQQSQVSADGVPTNPPPPSQPVEPTPLTQTNSNHGGALKTEQKNANHENKQDDQKPTTDVKPPEVKPEEEKEAEEERQNWLRNLWYYLSGSARRGSMDIEEKEETEEKQPYSQYDPMRVNQEEIKQLLETKFANVIEILEPVVIRESQSKEEYNKRMEIISNALEDGATQLAQLTERLKSFEETFLQRNIGGMMRRGSIMDSIDEIKNRLAELASSKDDIKEQIDEKENALGRYNANEISTFTKEITELKQALRNNDANVRQTLGFLNEKLDEVRKAGVESLVKMNELSSKSVQLMSRMNANFSEESKIAQTELKVVLGQFQMLQATLLENSKNDVMKIQQEVVALVKSDVSIQNKQLYDSLRAQLQTLLGSFANVIEQSRLQIADSIESMGGQMLIENRQQFLIAEKQRAAMLQILFQGQELSQLQVAELSNALTILMAQNPSNLEYRQNLQMLIDNGQISQEMMVEAEEQQLMIAYPSQEQLMIEYSSPSVVNEGPELKANLKRKQARVERNFTSTDNSNANRDGNIQMGVNWDVEMDVGFNFEEKREPADSSTSVSSGNKYIPKKEIQQILLTLFNSILEKNKLLSEKEKNSTAILYTQRAMRNLKPYGLGKQYAIPEDTYNEIIKKAMQNVTSPKKMRSGREL
jgi:hypothetical protein